MKVVILGDLHIGVKNNSEVMLSHQTKFFETMIEYMKENDIDTIFQLGDIFDSRRQINIRTIHSLFTNVFDKFQENAITLYSLVGNHDIYLRNSLETHSSGILTKGYPNIHIIDTPTTLEFGGKTFSLIPWICESNYNECMEHIKNDKSNYCLGHFEIGSFPVVGKILFEGGLVINTFSHYDHVFSGHFHLRSEKKNITYVGTPYQLMWSDAEANNGFLVLDTESGEYEFVENEDRIFRYVYFDSADATDLEQLSLEDRYVKLIVNDKSDTKKFNEFVDTVMAMMPTDLKIIDQEMIELKEMETPQTIEVSDTLDLIYQYIDNTDISNKEDVKKYMVMLYNEAMTQGAV